MQKKFVRNYTQLMSLSNDKFQEEKFKVSNFYLFESIFISN